MAILFLLALAAAPQPLAAQAAAPSEKPAPQTQPAPAAPYRPEFVIPKPDDASGQAPSSPATPVNPNRYKIGLNDEVKVTVFDEPDLSTMYRVDADGSISFPLIGRVQAAGTTLSELQQRITTMLAAGYIKNPQVRVEINQYKSQFVYVIGEVRAPGKITMTGTTMTLLEALALAVNRRDLELGKAGQDVVLQDGDIINVPSARHFYITGMVRNPGTFVLDPGISVQQAIALAGGLNDRGSDRRIKISRIVDGKLTDVSVDLEDKVEPGDTIMISGRFF